MQEELQLLLELQTLDIKTTELEKFKDEPSLRIKELEKDLLKKRKSIDNIKKKVEELNKKRAGKEINLDIEIEKIRKSEIRLMEAKTNKEYEALLKEISFSKELNGDIEEEIIEILDEIEEVDKKIVAGNSEFNVQKDRLEKKKKDFEANFIRFESELKEHISRREAIVSGIKPDLIKQYDLIRKKRRGIALARAKNCICQGCHINILPQLYNELQKFDSMIFCPNCRRILYFDNT